MAQNTAIFGQQEFNYEGGGARAAIGGEHIERMRSTKTRTVLHTHVGGEMVDDNQRLRWIWGDGVDIEMNENGEVMRMWFRPAGGLMQQVVERTEGAWVGDGDDAETREPRRLHTLPPGLHNRSVSANCGQQTRGKVHQILCHSNPH